MILRYRIFIVGLLAAGSLANAATGILELDSKPGGAEVFVDGKKKGTTPETEGQKLTMELAEGDHEILIKKEGTGSATRRIFIGEGVIQPLTLTIKPEAFTNSLGMKFVPVPGTQILMCIHETRNKDYAQYAAGTSGLDGSWKNVEFKFNKNAWTIKEPDDHPVVNVSWEDANAFCAWLGVRDGKTYRLPTDHEWSCAVGIGGLESPRDTPTTKGRKVPGFPWGAGWPPPRDNVGNYSDADAVEESNRYLSAGDLTSYHDGAMLTSSVMRYPPSKLGIYDLGGNVAEWCQDLYDPSENWRVARGACWGDFVRDDLLSSYRSYSTPDDRNNSLGFRCVVVVGGSLKSD